MSEVLNGIIKTHDHSWWCQIKFERWEACTHLYQWKNVSLNMEKLVKAPRSSL